MKYSRLGSRRHYAALFLVALCCLIFAFAATATKAATRAPAIDGSGHRVTAQMLPIHPSDPFLDGASCGTEADGKCTNSSPDPSLFLNREGSNPRTACVVFDCSSDINLTVLTSTVLNFGSCSQAKHNPSCSILGNSALDKLYGASLGVAFVLIVLLIIVTGFMFLTGTVFDGVPLREHVKYLVLGIILALMSGWMIQQFLNFDLALLQGFAGATNAKPEDIAKVITPDMDEYWLWLQTIINTARTNLFYTFNIKDYFNYVVGASAMVDLFILANFIIRLIFIGALFAIAPIASLCYVLPATRPWAEFWLKTLSLSIMTQSIQIIFLIVGFNIAKWHLVGSPSNPAISSMPNFYQNMPSQDVYIYVATLILILRVPSMLRNVYGLVETPFPFDDELLTSTLNMTAELDAADALSEIADVVNVAGDAVDDIDALLWFVEKGSKIYGKFFNPKGADPQAEADSADAGAPEASSTEAVGATADEVETAVTAAEDAEGTLAAVEGTDAAIEGGAAAAEAVTFELPGVDVVVGVGLFVAGLAIAEAQQQEAINQQLSEAAHGETDNDG